MTDIWSQINFLWVLQDFSSAPQTSGDSMEIVILILQLLILIAAAYLPAYLKQKGKNLAEKEDIESITKIVENIRRENTEKFETLAQQNRIEIKRLDQVNDLRLAALDERLKAYQEAYSLVFQMLSSYRSNEKVIEVMERCTNFWHNRSLYISEQARDAFDKAIAALHVIQSTFDPTSPPVNHTENRNTMKNALRVIERSVSLPEFSGEAEQGYLGSESEESPQNTHLDQLDE